MCRSFLLIALGVLAILAAITLVPNIHVEAINDVLLKYPGIDKPIHFFLYLLIFFATYHLSSAVLVSYSKPARMGISFLLALGISFIDEGHQNFVAGRSVEYSDVLANVLGIVSGLFLLEKQRLRPGYRTVASGIIVSLLTLLTYHSYRISIHYSRGLMLEKRQEYAQAKEEFLLALDAGNDNPNIYNTIAWIDLEYLGGAPETALEYAREAYSRDPDNPDVLDTYGWALHKVGRSEEALQYLSRAYDGNPNIYCIHHHLGAAYYEVGEIRDAVRHLEKQIALGAGTRDGIQARALLEIIRRKSN
jgi:tetratricopeptide (TPR) repeat protein